MKKRIVIIIVIISLTTVFLPTVSHAAVTPYFVAINDTLLPMNADSIPIISGGEVFVPDKVFGGLDVWAVGADDFVRLYQGYSIYVDFYTARGVTEDQDGNTLFWPPARRIGKRFYVPLKQVCAYFGLTYDIIEVPRDIIAEEQVMLVRIISSASFNDKTFLGLNTNALRKSYSEFNAPPTPPTPTPTGPVTPTPPVAPPPTDYRDVTLHLSFYNVTGESAAGILDLLDIQPASGYQSCFFVKSSDIRENPGLIRRISGSGHMIGILLMEGTYKEYLETSAVLYEAAKIKTVIVIADESAEAEISAEDLNGLILWESTQNLVDYDDISVDSVTGMITKESGARQNLMFSCSENAASVLPGIISYLRVNEYTVVKITETVSPIM